MEPIINPLWFHLTGLFDSIAVICSFILIFGGICTVIIWCIFGVNYGLDSDYMSEEHKSAYKTIFKHLKRVSVAILFSGVVWTAIPSKETMYYMLVSSYVTPDNLEKATDVIKDGVDYIFEKFEGNDD